MFSTVLTCSSNFSKKIPQLRLSRSLPYLWFARFDVIEIMNSDNGQGHNFSGRLIWFIEACCFETTEILELSLGFDHSSELAAHPGGSWRVFKENSR